MLRTTVLVCGLGFACLTTGCLDDEPTSESVSAVLGVPGERTVLEEADQPQHTMQDASHVYYMVFTAEDAQNVPQTMSVMRVRRSDGTTQKIASIVGYANHAALGGAFIYYADYESVYKLPKTGGQAQVVTRLALTQALAADASGVFVATPVFEPDRSFHRISKISAGSTAPVELARATNVTSLAVDGTYVYWLDETQPNPASGCGQNAGVARKVNKLGGLQITLKTGINCPYSLAVDSTSIYYTSAGVTGTAPVIKLSKAGGIAQVIGTTADASVVVDASYVYWISTTQDLMRLSKPIGVPRAIAHDVRWVVTGSDLAGVYFWRDQEDPLAYSLYSIGR